jgi:polysaccharide deacetylase 2 family uncharacterized protein YibQ
MTKAANIGETSGNPAQSRDVVTDVSNSASDNTGSLESVDMIARRQDAFAAHGSCADTSTQILAIEILDFGLPIHVVEMSIK